MQHLFSPTAPLPRFAPVDACCSAPASPRKLPPAPRRARLADIDANIHCSIIGTCLTTAALRKLIPRYVPDLARKDAGDVEIHHTAVNLSTEGGAVARELNKALDTRHALTIKKFSAAHDERTLTLLWQEAMAHGDVPGAYWALMTHPASTFDLRTVAFGDVHMLSHLVGASNRADIRRVAALEQEAAQLRQQAASQQARIAAMTRQHATLSDHARTLETRCAQYALASPEQMRDEITALRAALDERDGKLALHTTRRNDTEQKLAASQAQQASLHAELLACRTGLETAHAELHALEQSFGDAAGTPALPPLDGKCVLYVGGRPGTTQVIAKLVAAAGGTLLVHDGGIEDRHGVLTSILPRADVVVFPIDCISHNAMQVARQACARHGIACHPLRSASVASFIALMQRLAEPALQP